MNKIAIIGFGGFGREVEMLIEQINEKEKIWEFIGFFDDASIDDSRHLGDLKVLNEYAENIYVVIAIGNPLIKEKIVERIENKNIKYATLIHPSVQIGKSEIVNIGEGCIITAYNVITVNINIGSHVILNLSCTVGHDTTIADYCSFMPSVNISGEVKVNEKVFVGTGAKIINQVEIGESVTIGAGAVVVKSIPPKCTAIGIPAKPIN